MSGPAASQNAEDRGGEDDGGIRQLAFTLVNSIDRGSRIALLPLNRRIGLPEAAHKRFYDSLSDALTHAGLARDIKMVPGHRRTEIYRYLVESFDANLDEKLKSILNRAKAEFVVICERMTDDPRGITLSCAPSRVEPIEELPGGGRVRYRWKNEDEYLEYVVARLTRSVLGNRNVEEVRAVNIHDKRYGWSTALTDFIQQLVRQKAMEMAGEQSNPGATPGYGQGHRLDGEVTHPDKSRIRLVLDLSEIVGSVEDKRLVSISGDAVFLDVAYLPANLRPLDISFVDDTRKATRRLTIRERPGSHVTLRRLNPGEEVHITARVRGRDGNEWLRVELDDETTGVVLASSLGGGKPLPPGPVVGTPGGDEDDPDSLPEVRIELPDGLSVSPGDWALVIEESLESGRYERVLVEAKAHIEKHGPLEPLVRVRDRAVAELVGQFRIGTKAEAERELPRIQRIEASVGDWPELLRIKARAHRLLGDHSSEMETHERWLDADTEEHPDRREVLFAYRLARDLVKQGEEFANALGRPYSARAREESAGWTDLHHAALLDKSGVVLALVEAGMAPDVRLGKDAPFGEALKRTLRGLGHGDEFEHWSADGETPLMVAALANAARAAEELLERGAEHDARNERGSTPLHFAVLRDAHEVAKLLLDRGAELDAQDRDGMAPLHRAASVDANAVAELLLARGADADAKSRHGKTPLHHAAWYGAGETARLLVEGGAELDAREDDGDTPLHNAASAGALEVAELLLGRGANIDARNEHGRTPLHEAARRNAGKTARLLVERGAGVTSRAMDGSTPLHLAAWGDAAGIASLLLARGAEIDAKDEHGRTPLDVAAEAGSREAEALLDRHLDDAAFAEAKRHDTVASYREYLAAYPQGMHAAEARERRAAAKLRDEDDAAYAEAKRLDTVASYAVYLRSYSGGLHASEARALQAAARVREEDDAAFAEAERHDTVASYREYLAAYPQGIHAAEARERRAAAKLRDEDDAAYAEAKRLDTVASYSAYLSSYPGGLHASGARTLLARARDRDEDRAAFTEAKHLDTVAGYDRYLESRSRGRHVVEARRLRAAAFRREDAAAFSRAAQRDTVSAYARYLTSYPEGSFREQARRLRAAAQLREDDRTAYAEAKRLDTVAAYDEYLASYPQGRHAAEARRLRTAAAFREADAAAFSRANDLDTVAAYDEYPASHPQGLHASEARSLRAAALRKEDDAAFAEAKRKDTVAAFDGYLRSYPQGRHVAEARRLRDAASRIREIGQVFRDCDDCPELVVVPPGTYVMGSPPSEEGRDEDEGPRHRVVLAEAFAIGTAEVTRGEYARFVRDTGHAEDDSCRTYEDRKWKKRSGRDWRHPGYQQTDRHPVVCVNWDDAQRYVAWLSLKTGEDYRLPSEAEWEYAARAGTETSRHWGQGPWAQCRHANGADGAFKARHGDRTEDLAACDDGYAHSSPAARYGKNGFGLFDVLGNVWEWTADCGNPDYEEAPGDGRDWVRGNCSLRVLRGGSWFSEPSSLRSANRLLNRTRLRNANVGFRVVRALPLAPAVPSAPAAAVAAAEDGVFTRATTRNSVESYDEYLALYPTGRHAGRARNLRERAFGLLAAAGAFRDCVDCPEMAVVPAGSFELGSAPGEAGRHAAEGPSRQVTLGESFAIGVHEVTRREYAAFLRESGHAGGGSCWVHEQGEWGERADRTWRDPGYGQTGDHPAVCVSWNDAAAYADWLTRKTGTVYRLPSEAEWEYAARGGTRTSRHFGDDASRQCRYANGADETANRQGAGFAPAASCRDGYLETAPVGRYEANGFGLRDVLGNVWEWTRDCWNDGHGGASSDGRARERGDCTRRVLRGGSWSSLPRFLRSAHRGRNPAGIRVNDIGFRVARALPWGADDAAFVRAKGEGTVEAFEEYLRSYPGGRHVAEAERLIAGPKPGETFRDCAVCPRVVVVPSGRYRMGSPPDEEGRDRDEGRKDPVEIREPLAVGVFEVTFDEWDACVAKGGCEGYRPRDRGWGRGDRPVIFVSWRNARSYVEWLSRTTENDYRLLTEAEWEYVARANKPSRTRFTWGDAVGSGRANCESCGSRWDDRRTAPVGSFSANAFGVHDLHGNVAEWVEDCYESDYSKAPSDGTAFSRASCPKRVLRGGAWNDKPRYLRSANRSRSDPSTRAPGFGFRVVRSLP